MRKGVIISAYALPGLKGNFKFPVWMNSADKIGYIETIVSDYFGQSKNSLRTPKRDRAYVTPRNIIIFLLRRYTNLSLTAIGKMYNRDHTTVISSLKSVRNMMETDEVMRSIIQTLEVKVQ